MSFGRYTVEEVALHAPRITVLNEKNEIVRYEGDRKPAFKVLAR
jgi:aspartate 1-decarboxylase